MHALTKKSLIGDNRFWLMVQFVFIDRAFISINRFNLIPNIRTNSLLTGRILEQDQAHMLMNSWVKVEEKE